MSKFINGLVGFVVGATAGVITGLLVAPRKGEETRKIIKEKAKKTSQDIVDEFDHKKEKIHAKIRNFRDKVEEEVEEAIDKVTSAAQSMEAKAAKMANDVTGKVADKVADKMAEAKKSEKK